MIEPVRIHLPISDGAISCLAWETTGPLLHFAHATGFNAETYRSIVAPLAERFRIAASDQRGHGFSSLPVRPGLAEGWTVYRDDLVQILDRLGQPAILSGHSMGATVSLMAAAQRPNRVLGLVLLEPVTIPAMARLLRVWTRATGRNPGPDLAQRAAQRRATFPSFEAALAAYTGRGAFRSWPTAIVADYLRGGLVENASRDGVRLACAPAWEAETFRSTPFGTASLVRHVKCPITVLHGSIGSTCVDSEAALFARAGARVVKIDGASHFLPMEFSARVREEIVRLAANN